MRIYLSARFGRRHEMRLYRELLSAAGHDVTSRWLDAEKDDGAVTAAELAARSRDNLIDIQRADLFLAFTEEPSLVGDWQHADDGRSRGGRHVELGAFLARPHRLGQDIRVWVVGPRENAFHYHPRVIVFESWAAAFREIAPGSAAAPPAALADATGAGL